MYDIPIKQQARFYSLCCNRMVSTMPRTLSEFLAGVEEVHICKGCTEICNVELKPVYEEVNKGIYRKIEY